MFSLLRLIIWMAGVAVVGYFVLQYFGYQVNWNYWNERKTICEEKLTQCRKDIIRKGLDGAKESCNFQCVDAKLLIEKSATKK